MQKKFKGDYFPFGSQYYRAPSPHKDEWENDLKNMASLGFNTVKFWVQWRWNNPEEGKYYFEDIDKLMDLAGKFKLKVMLNTIFDVAPAWIYEKYPDASMITLGGKVVGPQTQPHRQIGGLGYCFNNDRVIKHFFQFLETVINRYKDHPALEIWNVGSEPELTSSMAEMRLYADNADKINDMLCYCDNCKKKFRKWLEIKYNSIDNLNESWNRNYHSFKQAEIPKTRNTFNDIIDWRMFFVYTIGENVKRRFETAKRIDQGKHLLMCHHVFVQGFPVTSTANDPWNVAQYGDIHGFTQMNDAMMIDILRSCAKDKMVISAEMLMLMGYTLDLPESIDKNDIKRVIFQGIAGNLKGFIFWQYRPEILGREAPAWGLTNLDGTMTPWLKSFAEIGEVLQKNADFLLKALPLKAEIAILYNPENQIFAWASTGNEKTATNSLLGYHTALFNNNHIIDFVHPREIDENILENYKVLIVPFPYCLNESLCQSIKSWVNNGGTLIGEAYFAGWNMEHGHHEKIVPGYGFDKVFKAKQNNVEPAEHIDIPIIINKDLTYINKKDKIQGAIIKEYLISEGAEVIASFENGEPAITVSEFGKGKAILIGSYIGLSNNKRNSDLINSIIEYSSNLKKYSDDHGKVRFDILTAGKEAMVIIQNLTNEALSASFNLPFRVKSLKEQFDNSIIKIISTGNLNSFTLELKPKEVKVYRV